MFAENIVPRNLARLAANQCLCLVQKKKKKKVTGPTQITDRNTVETTFQLKVLRFLKVGPPQKYKSFDKKIF